MGQRGVVFRVRSCSRAVPDLRWDGEARGQSCIACLLSRGVSTGVKVFIKRASQCLAERIALCSERE